MTTTMWWDINWSLNYTSEVRERDRLIHHRGDAGHFELAAVSSGALTTQEACFQITMQRVGAAKFSSHTQDIKQAFPTFC